MSAGQDFTDAVKVRRCPQKAKPPSPITLRLSTEERTTLEKLSQGRSMSATIREYVFGANKTRRKRQTHTPVQDQKSIAKILGLLGQSRIANNLNQLTYQANTGSLTVNHQTLCQIKETHTHIRFLRDQLIKALGLKEQSKP